MEHAIGTRITLEVVEGEFCKGCFFDSAEEGCLRPFDAYCSNIVRTDHKNIIYKEIKEE